jgi:hypothetical protein
MYGKFVRVFVAFGLKTLESLLVATALTATSIAISIQVLTELGKMQSKEARCRKHVCLSERPSPDITSTRDGRSNKNTSPFKRDIGHNINNLQSC